MNKIRLVPVIFIKNGFIVRSENFESHRKIGNVVNEVERYNNWKVDELVFIDISREKKYNSQRDDHKVERVNSLDQILKLVSKKCFMPLTFGGGIRDLKTIKKLINNGADKVILNTLLFQRPDIILEAVSLFGSQAITASVDYRINDKHIEFYIENGSTKLKHNFHELIKYLNDIKVGEIFLNSIDNDGKGEGYDFRTISMFLDNINLPIVGCGGASSIYDFKELAKLKGISGIAAGNMFHFTENIYPRAKKELKKDNFNFR